MLLPDLSDSLDGHLAIDEFSPLTTGGTPVAAFAALGDAAATLVIGASLYPAAERLAQRTGTPLHRFDHLWGLEANDRLIMTLAGIAGCPVPARLERQRAITGRHARHSFSAWPSTAGHRRRRRSAARRLHAGRRDRAEIVAAVTSCRATVLERIPVAQVHIGDLEDVEQLAQRNEAELLLGNSHMADVAQRLALPLLRMGFPLYDQIGAYRRTWIGYRGSRQTLFDLANGLLGAHQQPVMPYHSPVFPKTRSSAGGAWT